MSDPTSIADLFEKDPLQLTDAERFAIIQALRERRTLWLQEKKATGKAPRKSNLTPAKLLGLKMEDLDLSSLEDPK